MRKLFSFIIIVLVTVNIVGCSQGLFLWETLVIPQPEEQKVEKVQSIEEEQPIVGEIVEDVQEDEQYQNEQYEDGQEANSEQQLEDNSNQNQIDADEGIAQETDKKTTEEIVEEISQEDKKTAEIIREFNTALPAEINMNIKYDKYPIGFDYLLILKAAKVRQGPGLDEEVIHVFQANEKVSLIAEVKGEYIDKWGSDSWYQIEWKERSETKTGFVYAPLAEVRRFQFDKMAEALRFLKEESNRGELAHISNYKNVNGIPPKLNGSTWDGFGYRRSQSAAGHDSPQKGKNFRYIPDGMLLHVLEERDGFTKVKVIGWEGEYWVQSKYINRKNTLKELRKVIIIDRKFQNEAVFEFSGGKWSLISYTSATTGKNGPYSLETPLGYYMAIQKRDRFFYFKDGTQEIAGYSPYSIRFSGGGYIHGVPVNYIIKEGKQIDPGMKEYASTIGTIPLSHMCVRNYTSHAKFLYDWVEIGNSAIIVIE